MNYDAQRDLLLNKNRNKKLNESQNICIWDLVSDLRFHHHHHSLTLKFIYKSVEKAVSENNLKAFYEFLVDRDDDICVKIHPLHLSTKFFSFDLLAFFKWIDDAATIHDLKPNQLLIVMSYKSKIKLPINRNLFHSVNLLLNINDANCLINQMQQNLSRKLIFL